MRLSCGEFADLLLHLTKWPQVSHIDPHRLAGRDLLADPALTSLILFDLDRAGLTGRPRRHRSM
ncbi:hypothetical protein R6L23_15410 [Streptomyces sp. SR27]|uniref:hypothetical protein n=1 Tax=Streptomyces sp. SR27 TaxID=3076630 RepID=UPI00295A6C84|nr:hypothetical protein [Streptomyces sp. SR27]MDV9189584.1 hypothetical protein [Streptomyces sp. SR27]